MNHRSHAATASTGVERVDGSSVAIRPERPDDAEPVRNLLRAAFGVEKVVTLVDLIRASPGYLPDLSLVAEGGGAVVGHVMLSRLALRTDDGGRLPILTLSPLSVAPAVHRRGIGGCLLRAAVADARAARESLIVLEGDPAYYGRHGFERAADRGVRRPSSRIPEAGFMCLPLTPGGASARGAVEYSAPFWVTDCIGP